MGIIWISNHKQIYLYSKLFTSSYGNSIWMSEESEINRRTIIKSTGTIAVSGFGFLGTSGSAVASSKQSTKISAENYVVSDNYLYRRMKTDNSDFLLKFELDRGKVTYAKMADNSVNKQEMANTKIASSEVSDPLKKKAISMTTGTSSSRSIQKSSSTGIKPVKPEEIVNATDGYQTQDIGGIFDRLIVIPTTLGNCDSWSGYNKHRYFHVGMELLNKTFHGLLKSIVSAAFCDILFQVIARKSKFAKNVLNAIPNSNLGRFIPDGICTWIVQNLIQHPLNGSIGAFGFWDHDGSLLNEPKIAAGAVNEFNPHPQKMINNRTESLPGAHMESIL